MKKPLFLAFICLLGFYSCKKDADDKSKKIIGKWTPVKSVLLKSTNGTDSEYHTENRLGYTQFNKDGTVFSDFGFIIDNESFTYTLKKDSLWMAIGSDYFGFTIKVLANNSLVLRRAPLPNDDLYEAYFNEVCYTK